MDAIGRACSLLALVYIVFTNCFGECNKILITENGTIILDDNFEITIGFDPPELHDIFMGKSKVVRFNVTGLSQHSSTLVNQNVSLRVVSADENVAQVMGKNEFPLSAILTQNEEIDGESNETIQFTVDGLFLGRTRLKYYLSNSKYLQQSEEPALEVFSFDQQNGANYTTKDTYYNYELYDDNNKDQISAWKELPITYKVSVIRKERIIDHVFIIAVSLLVFCGNIGMGCKIELDVVKEVLKRPIAPSIGFASQYIIMPLTSFAVVKLLDLQAGVALGFFALGCSPGGSSSNIYTFLLDGDVSLSITMTLISTLASLAMIPLWLFTLGRLITGDDANTHIPIQNIFISLVSLMIPIAVGIIVRRKKPRAADFIIKCMKPFYLTLIIFMFTFGVYTNLYVFRLITPILCVAGCLLPYVGFLLGSLVAFLARQPFKRIYTIAIETGLQNTGIPIILLKFSLDQPEADMSVVSPVVTSMFGPMPLWITITVYEIYKRHKRRQKRKEKAVTTLDDLNNARVAGDPEDEDNDEESAEKQLMDSQDVNLNNAVKTDKNELLDGKLVLCDDSNDNINMS